MRVLLFTRYPLPGRAKTRLGAGVGHGHAAHLQAAFVLDELRTLSALGADVTVCCDPMAAVDDFQALFGPGPAYVPQRGADLGERMLNALHDALHGNPTGAVLIGSDLPDLPASRLAAAFAALASAPICLGPAPDGGFHLVGLSAPQPPGLFDAVDWGGADVLARTLANCSAMGLEPAILEPWPDVDTLGDLMEYARRNRDRQTWTMDYIRSHGLVPEAWNG